MSSLLRRYPFGIGADLEIMILLIDPSTGINIVSTHKTALFVTFEEIDLEFPGNSFSEEDDGGGLLGYGNHDFLLLSQDGSKDQSKKGGARDSNVWPEVGAGTKVELSSPGEKCKIYSRLENSI
jgi:hypothetical protein